MSAIPLVNYTIIKNHPLRFNTVDALASRFSTAIEIKDHLDLVIELLIDDVKRILTRGKSWSEDNFELAYEQGCKVVKYQLLHKMNLSAICDFEKKSSKAALKWALNRLVSSVTTALTDHNSHTYIFRQLREIAENYENTACYGNEIEEFETDETIKQIGQMDRGQLVNGFKNLYKFGETDFDDLQMLCVKYGIDVNEIGIVSDWPTIVSDRGQITIDFDCF